MRSLVFVALSGALFFSNLGSVALAQGAPSGFELALHGPSAVQAGRTMHVRGVAYRVHGLAELRALGGSVVRARINNDAGSMANEKWREARADRRGFFQLDVPVPSSVPGRPRLEVIVGDGRTERGFDFPVSLHQPWILDLVTDRVLYEPGETVHVWARLRDARSSRPLPKETIVFAPQGGSSVTGESGVAAVSFTIPKEESEGQRTVTAHVQGVPVRATYRVGSRATERLFADVRVTPVTAKPSEPVEITVTVKAASGAPVPGAKLAVQLDNEPAVSGTTGSDGVGRVALRAPAYLVHATGVVPISVSVSHTAYGSYQTRAELKLAVPLTLEVEAVPQNGVLAPETDGRLFVRVADGGGQPPPAGTPIEVTGAAMPGGAQRAKTDQNGIAVVATRLPAGAATRTEGSGTDAVTTVVIRIEGPLYRTAAIQVPVRLDVEVVPVVERPISSPGDTLSVSLSQRSDVPRRPVVVELLADDGLVEAQVVEPGVSRAKLQLPKERVGILKVRARPLGERGVVEEAGGVDAFIVRPSQPTFLELRHDKEVYDVRSTAELTLLSNPQAARSWAAVLVRDIAAQAGERAFTRRFMEGAFERAVLDPGAGAAEALLRTALTAYVTPDPPPARVPELLDELGRPREPLEVVEGSIERGVMRDPFPQADELRRRGMAGITQGLEAILMSALDEGRLNEVTTGRGTGRRLRSEILAEQELVTLGGEPLTLAMLEAADPSFSYANLGRRVGRARLVKLLVALAAYLDPGDEATSEQRAAAREPYGRWLSRMVAQGLIRAEDLADPWGGRFALQRSQAPVLVLAVEAVGLELCSPGPDGVFGNSDDLRDPFARAVPAGTPYAVSSGEDLLMERLSYLATGESALLRMRLAYDRVGAELREQELGEALKARASEGLALDDLAGIGTSGRMGGGGMGYGSGMGTSGGGLGSSVTGKAASSPRVVVSAPVLGQAGMAGLAQIVRERFPPTVLLAPAVALEPSGKTLLPIPLPDAVSTFLVEAIVWSADGWSWSAETRLRVEKATVVDAPVPRYATAGDALQLPVRVANRSPKEQTVTLVLTPGDAPVAQRDGVLVPAGDAVEVTVPLVLDRPSEGGVMVGAVSTTGAPLDAVRRPLTVLPLARRVRREVETLAAGSGTLELVVPAQATPRTGAEITVQAGLGMFASDASSARDAWRDAWLGRPRLSSDGLDSLGASGALQARAVGAAWGVSTIGDEAIAAALTSLTRQLGAHPAPREQAEILLGLAPAARGASTRPGRAEELESLLRALRARVSATVVTSRDDPELFATAAAALAMTAPRGDDLELPRELVRRARRYEVRVGEEAWIAAPGKRYVSTALIALAEQALGDRDLSFQRVRTLARAELAGAGIGDEARAWARVAASVLEKGAEATSVRIEVDGRSQTLALTGGIGRLPAEELSQPGRHVIRVELPKGAAGVFVRAVAEYGVPWDLLPEATAPLTVAFEGDPKKRDERAGLVMVVHNRAPRTVGRPVLELSLPAGAELDEDARAALRSHTAREPDATRGTLRLELTALPPGGVRRIPLPLRWSVAGRLMGLGVAAYAADEPEEVAITQPVALDIRAPEATK